MANRWLNCSRQPDDGVDIESDDKRERADSMESVGRVEVLNFEPPQLVQPNEVKVSRMEVMEKLEPVKTPLGLILDSNYYCNSYCSYNCN